MSEAKNWLTVSGIDVQVVRKAIKNLHLAVYPPNGHVRVAVPEHVTDDNVRLAVVCKLSWIKRQQQDFKNQPRQSERQYISGECHFFFGRRYRFELIECMGKSKISVLQGGKLKMFVKPGASIASKEQLLTAWYRAELKRCVSGLLDKWQPIVGEQVADWGVRKMKTKWGSCNIKAARIWLNLELAKKPIECIEYILVHEMVHLLERNHNEVFKNHMDRVLPQWRSYRALLNKSPLKHESWNY
ncbi:MAG: DUF45 domain-containing protein [Methylomarinum sp.]|nr:DUF45 domain-containing protein [Methylomarinum sp.]